MKVTQVGDIKNGVQQLLPVLRKEPILYSKFIGILTRIQKDSHTFGKVEPSIWLVQNEGKEVIGGACRTPPYPLHFSRMDQVALRTLARQVAVDDPNCKGVVGPTPEVETIAEIMSPSMESLLLSMNMILYALDKLKINPTNRLHFRKAGPENFELLSHWTYRFAVDCKLPEGPMSKERLTNELENRRFDVGYNTEGEPVLMLKVLLIEETLTARIGAVYTPDRHRGKGFATQGLAQVIRNLPASYKDRVALYADRNNPASNRVYRKLGFEELANIKMISWTTK